MEDPHGHCAPKSWTLPQMGHLEQPFSWMILGLPLPRNTHTNLVGGIPAPLKNDGVKVSWDYFFYSQLFLESQNRFHGSIHHQPTD